jgi:hypothetical protein
MTTHPLNDNVHKMKLIKKIQESVLSRWPNDPRRMDRRILELIYLAHASGKKLTERKKYAFFYSFILSLKMFLKMHSLPYRMKIMKWL